MISIEEFAERVEESFGIEEKGTLKPDTDYKDLEEWDSMRALILIAFVDTEFDVLLSGNDLKSVSTIREVYTLIQERKQ